MMLGQATISANRGGLRAAAACAERVRLRQGTSQLCDPLLCRTRLHPLRSNTRSLGLDLGIATARGAL